MTQDGKFTERIRVFEASKCNTVVYFEGFNMFRSFRDRKSFLPRCIKLEQRVFLMFCPCVRMMGLLSVGRDD